MWPQLQRCGLQGVHHVNFHAQQRRNSPKSPTVTRMATPRGVLPVTVGTYELIAREEEATAPRAARHAKQQRQSKRDNTCTRM